jgi:hypothetical protein
MRASSRIAQREVLARGIPQCITAMGGTTGAESPLRPRRASHMPLLGGKCRGLAKARHNVAGSGRFSGRGCVNGLRSPRLLRFCYT